MAEGGAVAWWETGMMGCRCERWRWLRWCAVACAAIALGLPAADGDRGQASDSGWRVIVPSTPGPAPRSQFGLAGDGRGHLYLFGGSGAAGALGDLWEYDAASGSWLLLPAGPAPALIEPHLAIDAQGQVWEFGGIAAPGAAHLTPDGHSYGLYEYQPTLRAWRDRTPADPALGVDWPPGREDHGFAFDARAGALVVFAGEGQGDLVLNDLWTYGLGTGYWARVSQRYAGSRHAAIAPREIYNISADAGGHLYLFGGAFLPPGRGAGRNAYANDLWRFDDASLTWTLLSGIPNGYDPTLPLPRHYYGQTVDAAGDFDILGGYLAAPETPPFFVQGAQARYAVPVQLAASRTPDTYALSDFWQYDPRVGWRDRSVALGVLAGTPMIPYALVSDAFTGRLYTFGGLHLGQDGLLERSNTLWTLDDSHPPTQSPPTRPPSTAGMVAPGRGTATSTPGTHTPTPFPSSTPG